MSRLPRWGAMPRLLGEKLMYLRSQDGMTQVERAERLALASRAHLVGAKLRALRQQQRLTQGELAHQLGLARQGYISNLETGRKTPSLDLVVQIANLFGVTTDYLLRDAISVTLDAGSGEDTRDSGE